jgi:hypothetical protein
MQTGSDLGYGATTGDLEDGEKVTPSLPNSGVLVGDHSGHQRAKIAVGRLGKLNHAKPIGGG